MTAASLTPTSAPTVAPVPAGAAAAPAIPASETAPEDSGLARVKKDLPQTMMSADKMFSSVGSNAGSFVVNNNFGTERAAELGSFEDDLCEVDSPPALPSALPFAPELVERYAALARERRMQVFEHGDAMRPDAEVALHAVAQALKGRLGDRKLLTSGFDIQFPLHSLYGNKDWSARVRRAVIFLYRSADDNAGQFFRNDNKTAMLRKQLDAVDAYLLVVVSAAGSRQPAGAADAARHFWCFDALAPEATQPAVPEPMALDTFDARLLMCVTWFPGLGAAEFRTLVDAVLPEPPPSPPEPAAPATPPAVAGAASAAAPPPSPPTREQRWRAGDTDRVLADLGVAFHLPADLTGPPGRSMDAGYHLIDPGQRSTAGHWILRRSPMLLVQHLNPLMALYLGNQMSARFRSGLLNLLFRLDSAQVHRLDADWLAQRFIAAADDSPDASRHLVDLLVATLDRSDGESLVQQVALSLARHACDHEQGLLARLPSDALAAAWAAAHPPAPDPDELGNALDTSVGRDTSDRFWSFLDNSEATRNLVGMAAGRQLAVLKVLMALCPHQRRTAAAALHLMLARGALHASAAASGTAVDQLSRLVLRWELVQLVIDAPLRWLACVEAVAPGDDATTPTVVAAPPPRPGRPTPTALSPAARALASDSLAALVYQLITHSPQSLPAALGEVLLDDAHWPRAAQALSKLLLALLTPDGQDSDEPDTIGAGVVVWLYRTLAGALLHRDRATALTVAAPLQALAMPLREALHPAQRRAIADSARENQDSLLSRRDFFEALQLREQLAAERRSLLAMQCVVRAFSGTPALAPRPL